MVHTVELYVILFGKVYIYIYIYIYLFIYLFITNIRLLLF